MRIPIYGNKKLIAAFEYGLTLREVVGEKLDKEMVQRAEDILVKEFSTKSHKRVVLDTTPNLLAAIEPKEKKSTVKK